MRRLFQNIWDSIYEYYVYDKNNLEKTHKANDEIEIAKKKIWKNSL